MTTRKRNLYAEAPHTPPIMGWFITSIILACAAGFVGMSIF